MRFGSLLVMSLIPAPDTPLQRVRPNGKWANGHLYSSPKRVAYYYHLLPFLSYAGCYVGSRLGCFIPLQLSFFYLKLSNNGSQQVKWAFKEPCDICS